MRVVSAECSLRYTLALTFPVSFKLGLRDTTHVVGAIPGCCTDQASVHQARRLALLGTALHVSLSLPCSDPARLPARPGRWRGTDTEVCRRLPHCTVHDCATPDHGPPHTMPAVLALLVAEVGPAGTRARRAKAAAERVAVTAPVRSAVAGRPAWRLAGPPRARIVQVALRACTAESHIAA